MAASSCWTASYLRDLENGMPADDEQYPAGLLAAGVDKIDVFMARAGDPILMLGQEFDSSTTAACARAARSCGGPIA